MAQGLTTGVTHSSGSFELLAGAGLFALFGWFLDGLFGTIPLFILIGAAFGFSVSAFSLLLQYRSSMATQTQARADLAARTSVRPAADSPATTTDINERAS